VELYDDFDSWAQLNGFKPGDSRRLSNGLSNRGFEGSRTKDIHRRKQFMGIRLLNETEKASNEFNRADSGAFGG